MEDTDAVVQSGLVNAVAELLAPYRVELDGEHTGTGCCCRQRQCAGACPQVYDEFPGLDIGDKSPHERGLGQEVLVIGASALVTRRVARAPHGDAPPGSMLT